MFKTDRLETADGQTYIVSADGIYTYIRPSLPPIIYQVWWFNSFPKGPGGAPTDDWEFANKKYVDDSLATVAPLSIVSKSGTYTATTTDDVILCTSTWTLSLYTSVGNTGKTLTVKNIGAGAITIDPNGAETIETLSSIDIGPGASAVLLADGANWEVI